MTGSPANRATDRHAHRPSIDVCDRRRTHHFAAMSIKVARILRRHPPWPGRSAVHLAQQWVPARGSAVLGGATVRGRLEQAGSGLVRLGDLTGLQEGVARVVLEWSLREVRGAWVLEGLVAVVGHAVDAGEAPLVRAAVLWLGLDGTSGPPAVEDVA